MQRRVGGGQQELPNQEQPNLPSSLHLTLRRSITQTDYSLHLACFFWNESKGERMTTNH